MTFSDFFALLFARYQAGRNRVRSAVLGYLARDLGPTAALVVGYGLGWVDRDETVNDGKRLLIHLKG